MSTTLEPAATPATRGTTSSSHRDDRGDRGERVLPLWLIALPVVIGVIGVAVRPITDEDAWWNLRTGQWLRETWRFAGPDPFSSFSSHDFVLTEWTGDLVASIGYDLVGPSAVILLRAVALITLAGLFLYAARQVADLVPAVVATFVGLFTSTVVGERPLAAGVVLTMVAVILWRRSATSLRPSWWMVPLTWLWACTHGSWVIGPVIGLVTLVGLCLDRTVDRRAITRFVLVIVASVAAAGLTPVGPRLLTLPFTIHTAASGLISEWQFVDLTNPVALIVVATALLLALGWMRSGAVPAWWRVAHCGLALALGLSYFRMITIAACLLVPLVAEALQALRHRERGGVERRERRAFGVGLVIAVVAAAAMSVPLSHTDRNEAAPFRAALDAMPRGTVLFNYYNVSSWLVFAEPQIKVVIDTRLEVYDAAYVGDYLKAYGAQPGWRDFVDRTGATRALLPTESALAVALQERSDWRVLQQSGDYTLLAAPDAR